MGSREIITCDKCGCDMEKSERLYLDLGRVMDAAGSMEDEVRVVDLCDEHLRIVIQNALSSKGCPSKDLRRDLSDALWKALLQNSLRIP